jgi:hypothetical protein
VLYQLSYTRTMQNTQGRLSPTRFTATPTGNHFWWRGLDSNQRTQRERIYSPSPLTTRPPLQKIDRDYRG